MLIGACDDIVTVEHYDLLMNTDALPLAVRGWHELLDLELIDRGAILVQFDHHAVVARVAQTPVAVLTWMDQEWSNALFVVLAYVLPEHRRRGLHSRYLWPAVIDKARERNRPVIYSGASIRNHASRALQRSQGRIESSVATIFAVPPRPAAGEGEPWP